MKSIKLLAQISFIGILLTLLTGCYDDDENFPNILTDIDGNIYKTVMIGDQVWMAENLNVTRYRNGDPIPNMQDSTEWINCNAGAYCDYNNTPEIGDVYGKLYNGYCLLDERNLAPEGWHLPSDEEWTKLVEHLGGNDIAGDKLKELSLLTWRDLTATNESGFTALPGGNRNTNGLFLEIGDGGYWWSCTENSSTSMFGRGLYFYYSGVFRGYRTKTVGFSVRCVKD